MATKHKYVSSIPNGGDTTLVQPSNWNDLHNTADLVTSYTGNVTLTYDVDETVKVSAISGNAVVTLPTAVGNTGRRFTIVRANTTNGFYVQIVPQAGQSISTLISWKFLAQEQFMTVVSDGANWHIVACNLLFTFEEQLDPDVVGSAAALWASTSDHRLWFYYNGTKDRVVGDNTVDTLTNKTLISPVISNPTVSGGTYQGGTFTNPTLLSPTISGWNPGPNIAVFTSTAGTGTFVIPPNVTRIKVTAVGGGAAGGGSPASGSGSGGQGGSAQIKVYSNLTPGNTIQIMVGAGGTGVMGGQGNSGANTYVFSGTQIISQIQANGGIGGQLGNNVTALAGPGFGGDYFFVGMPGGAAQGSAVSGVGGAGYLGGGGNQVASNVNGQNGTNGTGGAGSGGGGGAGNTAGGNGGSGIVIIEWNEP